MSDKLTEEDETHDVEEKAISAEILEYAISRAAQCGRRLSAPVFLLEALMVGLARYGYNKDQAALWFSLAVPTWPGWRDGEIDTYPPTSPIMRVGSLPPTDAKVN